MLGAPVEVYSLLSMSVLFISVTCCQWWSSPRPSAQHKRDDDSEMTDEDESEMTDDDDMPS